MTLQDDLLTLERGFWEALGHPEFYEQHMTDNGLVVFGFEGGIMDKASIIPTVLYTSTAQREDAAEYRANITSVYVRRGGAWKLALHQQTPIAAETSKP